MKVAAVHKPFLSPLWRWAIVEVVKAVVYGMIVGDDLEARIPSERSLEHFPQRGFGRGVLGGGISAQLAHGFDHDKAALPQIGTQIGDLLLGGFKGLIDGDVHEGCPEDSARIEEEMVIYFGPNLGKSINRFDQLEDGPLG